MKYKKKIIIDLEVNSKTDFGIQFMVSMLDSVVKTLNGYKKCYKAEMSTVTTEKHKFD